MILADKIIALRKKGGLVAGGAGAAAWRYAAERIQMGRRAEHT